MFSRPVPPSHSWSATPRGSSVHRQTHPPSSTSGQGYIPEMFGSFQGHPRHNPSPPSNTQDDRVVLLLEALNDRIFFLEQQLSAPHHRRVAQKNTRNSVVRAFIGPASGEPLSRHCILDKCQRANHPLNLVFAVQRPQLAPANEVLLIVRSDEEAEQIRNDVEQFTRIFGAASYFCPESFYVTPSAFSKDDLKRMSAGKGAKHDYCELFKGPNAWLEAWRKETGLDIKRAYWKHGYLWLCFDSVAEARKAVSGKFYHLFGFQTQFISRDPRSVPMQCFKCQDLGHMSNRCRHEVPRCGYCASGHRTDQCQMETATKKCAIRQGPHEGYRLSECRHPRVIDVLEKCKLWRGPASWDKSAARRVQSGVFEGTVFGTGHAGGHASDFTGQYTGAGSADLAVDDAFPGHDTDLDDEAGFFDDTFFDEPVHYNTAPPSHPMTSPDQSFNNPVEFCTTSLAPGLMPHTSGNRITPFNRAPGTPILTGPSPSPSITRPAPGATPHTSGTTIAPFSRAPGMPILRSPSPSPSDTGSASRTSLLECLENLPRSSSSRRASREALLQTVAQIACEAERVQSQSHSSSSSFSRTDLGSTPESNFGSAAGFAPESTPGPSLDSTPGSNVDSATGSAKSDLGSDSRLDTSSTVGSLLSSLPRPAPDSAAQVDSRDTVYPRFTFSCPPPNVNPLKRLAEQDEHSSARREPKRVRVREEALIPKPPIPAEAREEATKFYMNLDKAHSYALDKDSGVEDSNGCSEGNTRDEPMAGQAEDRERRDSQVSIQATSRTSPSKVQHPETSRSATEDTAQLGNHSGSPLPGDAAPGSSPAEALDSAGPTQSSGRVTRSSALRSEAAAIIPQTPRRSKTSAEEISPGTSFASTMDGSPRARDSWTTPETDTSSSTWTPTTASSPCPTGDGDGESLPTPASATSPVPPQEQRLLRSQRTQPNPNLGQQKGCACNQDVQDTSRPQTQSDDHQLESLDESNLGDVKEDCISVKVRIQQTKLDSYFSLVPGRRVE